MKKLLVLIIVFCQCTTTEERSKKIPEYDQRIDETFLGFRFGMSSEEFEKHLKDLDSSDKIILAPNDTGIYTFNSIGKDSKSINFNIVPGFKNNKLYQLELKMLDSSKIHCDIYKFELNTKSVDLMKLFKQKYGKPFNEMKSKNTMYIAWYNSNQRIEYKKCPFNIKIKYTDIELEKENSEKAQRKHEKRIKQNLEDI